MSSPTEQADNEEKQEEEKPKIVWFEERPPFTPREVGPRDVPLKTTYQEAVWCLVLKALHAGSKPMSTGIKKSLKQAYGEEQYKWIKVVRGPLNRRFKDVCYPEEVWHPFMALEVLENELGGFALKLPVLEDDIEDEIEKMEQVGREVEKLRLARKLTMECKPINALEAKEAVLEYAEAEEKKGWALLSCS